MDVPEVGLSSFAFPRRLTHPTSGRSPDSRFIGLTAFPTDTTSPRKATPVPVSGILVSPPRSQWRGRAGISPASLLSFQKHQKQIALFDYTEFSALSTDCCGGSDAVLVVIPNKRSLCSEGIWASRAKRRAFCDAIAAHVWLASLSNHNATAVDSSCSRTPAAAAALFERLLRITNQRREITKKFRCSHAIDHAVVARKH
jgi:hypothetical protein